MARAFLAALICTSVIPDDAQNAGGRPRRSDVLQQLSITRQTCGRSSRPGASAVMVRSRDSRACAWTSARTPCAAATTASSSFRASAAESKLILRLIGSSAGLQMPPTGELPVDEVDDPSRVDRPGRGDAGQRLRRRPSSPPTDPAVQTFFDADRAAGSDAVRRSLAAEQGRWRARPTAPARPP